MHRQGLTPFDRDLLQQDCIIFEGWSTGFQAVPQDTLADAYAQRILPNGDAAIKQAPLGKEHLKGPLFLRHSLESLLQINRELEAYNALWNFIDCFIQIEPADMSLTWTWRLQVRHLKMPVVLHNPRH